jgi:NACHT domain
MLRSPEWQSWLDGTNRFLWIHGIPGAGKTILASFLIEQAKARCSHNRHAVIYYYCYFANNQDEANPLLKWFIGQLCRKSKAIPREIMDLYHNNHEPTLTQLLQALDCILQEFDSIYILIDAVDESLPRDNLIRVIRDLVTDQRFSKIRVLATSREYIDIETTFSPISISVSMSNDLVTEDIGVYVSSTLRSNPKFVNWQQDLLLEVEETLSKGAKGM